MGENVQLLAIILTGLGNAVARALGHETWAYVDTRPTAISVFPAELLKKVRAPRAKTTWRKDNSRTYSEKNPKVRMYRILMTKPSKNLVIDRSSNASSASGVYLA